MDDLVGALIRALVANDTFRRALAGALVRELRK